MSFVVLCLLLVEHQQLGAFTLLGVEVGFCLLQGKSANGIRVPFSAPFELRLTHFLPQYSWPRPFGSLLCRAKGL